MKSTELKYYHHGNYEELWQVGAIDEFYAPALNENLQLNIAKNPNTSEKVLQALAENCDRNFLGEVIVENPNIPVSLLEDWLGNSNISIVQAVTCHPKISLHVLIEFYTQHKIVQNLDTAGEVLEQLATSRSKSIRHSVFKHRNTPNDVREQLTEFIKYNEENEEEISDFLGSEDDSDLDDYNDWQVKISVARHPNTPATALEELAKSSNEKVRQVVAQNANTKKAIAQLLQDTDKNVRSTSWLERYVVASNPSTPVRILDYLSKDANRVVRAAAKANFEYSYKIHP